MINLKRVGSTRNRLNQKPTKWINVQLTQDVGVRRKTDSGKWDQREVESQEKGKYLRML